MPQSNKQHAVPQNFMDVEFKLIGDLTMRQFSYLMIFGILSYVSASVIVGIFKWPFAIFFALMGLGLDFVPVEERVMDDWVVNFIKAINTPTQRIWKKEPEIPSALAYENINVVKQEMITLAPTSSRRKLEEYLRYQSGTVEEDPLDIPEKEYTMKVHEAFYYEPAQGQGAAFGAGGTAGVGVSVEEEPEEWLPPGMETPKETSGGELQEEGARESGGEEIRPVEEGLTKNTPEGKANEEKNVSQEKQTAGEKKEQVPHSHERQAHKVQERKEPKFLLATSGLKPKSSPGSVPAPMTPDTHSGRKFSNLLPSSGELILPIRGERVLRSSDQVIVDENIEEKAEKLEQLLTHIREKEGIPSQRRDTPGIGSSPVVQAKDKSEKQQEKRPQDQERMVQIQPTVSSQMPKTQAAQVQQPSQIEQSQAPKTSQDNSVEVAKAFAGQEKIYPLTQQPDVISGIVKDSNDQIIPNALMIIRNAKDEAVRAFKTNSMGQFVLLTPMDKGTYRVEISKSNNLPETFDIISVEVKGEVIPPIVFRGK